MEDHDIIDRISAIRTRNNVQWMRVLEIALEHAPEETKRVLKQINTNDLAISGLLKGLTQ